jgi:hypothetical protein
MKDWEYMVETINTEYEVNNSGNIEDLPRPWEIIQHRLNVLGEDGWELVGFLPAAPEKDFRGNLANPWMVHAVLKRRGLLP